MSKILNYLIAIAIFCNGFMFYQHFIVIKKQDLILSSCGLTLNIYQQPIRWEKLPVEIYSEQAMPKKAKEILIESINSLNQISDKTLIVYKGIKTNNLDNFNMVYWKQDWESDRFQEQARTSVKWSSRFIVKADILINNKNFNYPSVSESPIGPDLKTLFIHELGHFLGLRHEDSYFNIMNTSLANNTVKPIDEQTREKFKCIANNTEPKGLSYVQK